MSRIVLGLSLAVLGLGCGDSLPRVSPTPIPAKQGPGGGGLYVQGAFGDGDLTTLLVDTGTVLTAHSVATPNGARMVHTKLRLYDAPADDVSAVPRALFDDVRVLETPLGAAGIAGADLDLSSGGILGGDQLRRFSLELHYGTAASIALMPEETACSCMLADACRVVMPFRLAGGGVLALGNEIYEYPATRVTIDACLEPVTDPLPRGVECLDGDGRLACGYSQDGAPGVDVKLLVSTGFSGVLLGASAYDRLCTQGERFHAACPQDDGAPPWHARLCRYPTASELLTSAELVELRFPGLAEPVLAAPVTLGDDQAVVPLASMVLVGREKLLSACGEMARSRRLRAAPPGPGDCGSNNRPPPPTCLQVVAGDVCGSPNHCNDRNQHAAGMIELDQPMIVYIVPDAAPVLQEINFDVRPALADVEGVVGSELLARLEARIDYPKQRVIAHCGCAPGCTAYPRYACATGDSAVGDCDGEAEALCNPPSSILPHGPLCLPAPSDPTGDRDAGASPTPSCDLDGGT